MQIPFLTWRHPPHPRAELSQERQVGLPRELDEAAVLRVAKLPVGGEVARLVQLEKKNRIVFEVGNEGVCKPYLSVCVQYVVLANLAEACRRVVPA